MLRKEGKGNLPLATRELEPEEVDILFRMGFFSISNSESLLHLVWWIVSLHFGFRARDEARKLKWGDVQLGYDVRGEFIEWKLERGTKLSREEMKARLTQHVLIDGVLSSEGQVSASVADIVSNDDPGPSNSQLNVISNSQSSSSSSKSSMFSGQAFQNCNNCTFNFNLKVPPKTQHRNIFRLLSSSDSDD